MTQLDFTDVSYPAGNSTRRGNSLLLMFSLLALPFAAGYDVEREDSEEDVNELQAVGSQD
jgi:hypothetical protein